LQPLPTLNSREHKEKSNFGGKKKRKRKSFFFIFYFITNQISLECKVGAIQVHEKYTRETTIKKKIMQIMSTGNRKTIIGNRSVAEDFEEKGL
jgi:hypothetical protein